MMGSGVYRSVEDKLALLNRAKRVGVSQACRELGFSRGHYYRLRRRYESHGKAGLRPKARHRLPRRRFKSEVVEAILWVTHARPRWSREQVAEVVQRESGRRWKSRWRLRHSPSPTGVYSVWRRHGLT